MFYIVLVDGGVSIKHHHNPTLGVQVWDQEAQQWREPANTEMPAVWRSQHRASRWWGCFDAYMGVRPDWRPHYDEDGYDADYDEGQGIPGSGRPSIDEDAAAFFRFMASLVPEKGKGWEYEESTHGVHKLRVFNNLSRSRWFQHPGTRGEWWQTADDNHETEIRNGKADAHLVACGII